MSSNSCWRKSRTMSAKAWKPIRLNPSSYVNLSLECNAQSHLIHDPQLWWTGKAANRDRQDRAKKAAAMLSRKVTGFFSWGKLPVCLKLADRVLSIPGLEYFRNSPSESGYYCTTTEVGKEQHSGYVKNCLRTLRRNLYLLKLWSINTLLCKLIKAWNGLQTSDSHLEIAGRPSSHEHAGRISHVYFWLSQRDVLHFCISAFLTSRFLACYIRSWSTAHSNGIIFQRNVMFDEKWSLRPSHVKPMEFHSFFQSIEKCSRKYNSFWSILLTQFHRSSHRRSYADGNVRQCYSLLPDWIARFVYYFFASEKDLQAEIADCFEILYTTKDHESKKNKGELLA